VAKATAGAEIEGADEAIRRIILHDKQNIPGWADADLSAFQTRLRPVERLAYFAQRFFDCQLFLVELK
jgi:hypothetical protein